MYGIIITLFHYLSFFFKSNIKYFFIFRAFCGFIYIQPELKKMVFFFIEWFYFAWRLTYLLIRHLIFRHAFGDLRLLVVKFFTGTTPPPAPRTKGGGYLSLCTTLLDFYIWLITSISISTRSHAHF
jgi:hypothetical protein